MELMPAAAFLSQTSRADTEMHALRKRQSFSFGDNRLGPSVLADQSWSETQPPPQSPMPSAHQSSADSAAVAAVALGLPQDSMQSPHAVAHSVMAGKAASSNLSMHSVTGNKPKQAHSSSVLAASCRAEQQAGLQFSTDRQTVPSSGLSVSRDKSSAGRGRAAASATPAETAPAVKAKPSSSQSAATKTSKSAANQKPGWQH